MPKEYIEKEAAIETFEQAFDNNWEVSGTLDRIRAIPAADVVERKKGHINEDMGGNRFCTECGIQLVTMYLDESMVVTRPNFCPKCGAVLREGKDG